MDDDARDGLRVGESGVREGLCAVGGLVDADAGHGRAEQVRLARADPHDVGIRWRDSDVADARRGLSARRRPATTRHRRRSSTRRSSHRRRRCGARRSCSATAMSVARPLMFVGPSGCQAMPRYGDDCDHRAIRVVGLAQILGVCLRALLCPHMRHEQGEGDPRQERRLNARADRFRIIPQAYHRGTGSMASWHLIQSTRRSSGMIACVRHDIVEAVEALPDALFDAAEREQHGHDEHARASCARFATSARSSAVAASRIAVGASSRTVSQSMLAYAALLRTPPARAPRLFSHC